jgi:cytochrome P450
VRDSVTAERPDGRPAVIPEVVAVLVLLAAPAPLGRLVVDADFAEVFPLHRRVVGAALACWVVLVAVITLVWQAALVPLAVVAALGSILLMWRARPRHGHGRRLPPGSLSLTRSVRDLARRDSFLELAAVHGPVFKASQFTGPVVCIVGLERGQRLVREHRDAIGPSPLAFTEQIMGGFLRYMDDDTHDLYGPLFRRAMSRAVTDAAEPVARAAVIRSLQAVTAEPTSPDAGLARVAYDAVLHAMFGIDASSDLGIEFTRAYDAFAGSAIKHPRHRRTVAALDELRGIVGRQVDLLDGPSGVVGQCALSELRSLDPRMPDRTCIDNLLFMLRIGSNNVASLLRWIIENLGADPCWRDRLLDDPDLCDAFVSETLRLAQSEYVYRRLVADVEFDGFHLPAGWLVRICVWESHRDPAIYDDPTRLTDRFLGTRRPQSEYCPFGFDRHACNSVGLATMIARTVLREYSADPAVTVRPAGDVTRDLRHWSHWRPGPSLAVERRAVPASGRQPVGEIAIDHPLQSHDVVAEDLDETTT